MARRIAKGEILGSMMKRSGKKAKTTCHVLSPLGYNTNDYEDETLRSLQVLKVIIQYGQNSLTNVNEADPDKISKKREW